MTAITSCSTRLVQIRVRGRPKRRRNRRPSVCSEADCSWWRAAGAKVVGHEAYPVNKLKHYSFAIARLTQTARARRPRQTTALGGPSSKTWPNNGVGEGHLFANGVLLRQREIAAVNQ